MVNPWMLLTTKGPTMPFAASRTSEETSRGLSRLPRRQRESNVLRIFADLTEAQKATALGR